MKSEILESLRKNFEGDIDTTPETLKTYSRDASLFEIKPELVLFPKHSKDVQSIVRLVNEHKKENPSLSITARSAGTDMTGGPLNESIILDFTRFMNKVLEVKPDFAIAEPGCLYRDFDKETRKINRMMPAYTASRDICALGGMVGNNAGGEKSIKYGKVENHIKELDIIFSDGKEYTVKPLTKKELEEKISKNDFESELYKKVWQLIESNYDVIMSGKPDVSKNSSGYYLWNVYDKETGTFDLCRLIVGSQGTLGIVTKIKFNLVPTPKYSNLLVVFLPSLDHISDLVKRIVPYKPESLETYDDKAMILAVRFFFDFIKRLGFWRAFKLGLQFIPETFMMITGGVPKIVLMIEFTGQDEKEVKAKLIDIREHITDFHFKMHIARNSGEAEKYWDIRHESFNLLRSHAKNMRSAPFVDDIVVKPEVLPEFLPKVKAVLDSYKLDYMVQGHLGNGNFHLIPLMNLASPISADIILEISEKVYKIVKEYKGSNSAEHNDGIVRSPYLREQFGEKIYALFEETKKIFDPQNIFNPNKKVGTTVENIKKWIIKIN